MFEVMEDCGSDIELDLVQTCASKHAVAQVIIVSIACKLKRRSNGGVALDVA